MSRLPAARAAAGLVLAALSTLHRSPATAQEPPPAPVLGPDAVAAPAPIRIVPPAEARGRVRIDAIATDPEVARVVFLVDGEEAGSDGRPPYRLRLELEPDSGPRTLRALAYDREGRQLGEHAITLGAAERPFEVAIRRLLVRETGIGADRARPGTSEELEVEVDVAVPPGGRLDRLEIYRNRELVARLREPPFRARFSTSEPHPEDYLRAVAHLADGRVREDARPLAAAGGGSGHGERVEVNLVEVFAVATGRAGGAVHGLGRRGLPGAPRRPRAGDGALPGGPSGAPDPGPGGRLLHQHALDHGADARRRRTLPGADPRSPATGRSWWTWTPGPGSLTR
jgi:hypothetical protein